MNPSVLNGGTSPRNGRSPGLFLALAAICLLAGLCVISSADLTRAKRNGVKEAANSARDARFVEVSCGARAGDLHPAQRAGLLRL